MKRDITKIRKKKRYSEDFKRELVSIYERGQYSVLQLEKLYGVCNPSIYSWIYRYSEFNEKGIRIVEMKDSHLKKLKELEEKVKHLEQTLGQKQIKIDFLEKLIDLASDEYKVDFKKNSNTQRSSGSEKTEKK